jgi:hypothetical protein
MDTCNLEETDGGVRQGLTDPIEYVCELAHVLHRVAVRTSEGREGDSRGDGEVVRCGCFAKEMECREQVGRIRRRDGVLSGALTTGVL